MHIVRKDSAPAPAGLNTVEEILADIAAGKMVVIMTTRTARTKATC
jgi:hypothetical protein